MTQQGDLDRRVSTSVAEVFRTTWAALLRPRQAIPILAVVVPVLLLQVRYSGDDRSLFIGALLCMSFVVFAPVSWRVFLFNAHEGFVRAALGLALFVLSGTLVVVTIGYLLPRALHMPPTFLTYRATLLSCLALYLVGGWGLGRAINLEDTLTRAKARAVELERAAEDAQLLALKSHLDPHFLFNTLNAIAEWCRMDGVVAERAVLQLSELLREVMGGIHEAWWPLDREVALAQRLFDLHAVRDAARFTSEVHLDAAAQHILVPPMLLLPLAENAMKHGPGAGHVGAVRLCVMVKEADLHIELQNPGPYRGRREGGAGVTIVERRLRLSFGDTATLALVADANTTRATIVIADAVGRALAAPRIGPQGLRVASVVQGKG